MIRRIVILGIVSASVMLGAGAQEIQSPINGHYYSVVAPEFTGDIWASLQADAVAAGGNLATIRSAAENQWIVDTFRPLISLQFDSIYLGFNDIAVEGTFEWVSGEPITYTNWNGGEPNNAGGEDYMEFNLTTGGWNDQDNLEFQPGVMERIVFEFKTNPAGGGFIEEGSDITFSAEAWGGTGPVTYQWTKDGVDISGETTTSLTLTNLTSADDGAYALEASDTSKSTIVSASVGITVVAPGSLPVAGIVGIAALLGVLGIGGATVLVRKRR